jgi:NADH:ubiquinone oxidoreductase subunit K
MGREIKCYYVFFSDNYLRYMISNELELLSVNVSHIKLKKTLDFSWDNCRLLSIF